MSQDILTFSINNLQTRTEFLESLIRFFNPKNILEIDTENNLRQTIESLREKESSELFDFVVFDTAHIYPTTHLAFLAILPFLTKNAVVALPDLGFYHNSNNAFFACSLYKIVTAKKIAKGNRGAFQIDDDTWANAKKIFTVLGFPWEAESTDYKFYFRQKTIESAKKIIFYGGGELAIRTINLWKILDLPLPCEIWDINAGTIQTIKDIPVVVPRFEENGSEECLAVIAIDKYKMPSEVDLLFEKFHKIGYSNVFHINDLGVF